MVFRNVRNTFSSAVFFVLLASACSSKSGSDDFFDGGSGAFGQYGNSALSISPVTLAFPPTRTFTASYEETLTITNTSNYAVLIKALGDPASDHYSIRSTTCPVGRALSFAPGNSCSLRVVFNPTAVGPIDWNLIIEYTAGSDTQVYRSVGALTGIGATNVIFPGVATVDTVRARSVTAHWSNVPNQNGYACFIVNSGVLALITTVPKDSTSCVLTGLSPNTAYQIRVRAFDYFAGLETNSHDVAVTTLPDPVLTTVADRTYSSAGGPLLAGSTLTIDIDNQITGNDQNLYYQCVFDNFLDGTVSAGADCATLPGLVFDPGFSGVLGGTAGNGRLAWTPPSREAGKNYEIKITANDSSIVVSSLFQVNIRAPYKYDSSLLAAYQSQAVFGNNNGRNSPFTQTWRNLGNRGSSLDLSLASGLFSTGWLGDGTYFHNPFRLSLAGTSGASADRAIGSTGLNSEANLMFSTWVRPATLSPSAPGYIMGNSGSSANGWSLRQKTDGNYELSIGPAVQDHPLVINTLGPAAYFKFDDSSSTSAFDEVTQTSFAVANSGSATPTVVGAYTGSTAWNFTGNAYVDRSPAIDIGGNWAIAAWIKTPLPNDGQWKTLVRGASNDHQIIFQFSDNQFGTYISTSGGFHSSGVFANALTAGWHHFAAVGTGTATRFFVDGGFVSEYAGVSTTEFYAIGNFQGGGQAIYNVDDVALFTRTLTDTEIQQIYTGNISGCTAPISPYWNFIAGIFDGTKASLFKGATKVCEFTPSAGSFTTSTNTFTMGAHADGTNAWAGEIGSAYFYQSGIAADITQNFSAEYPLYGFPSSCKTWRDAGLTTDGLYMIDPDQAGPVTPIQVYCDMNTEGGGYTFYKVFTGNSTNASAAESYCSARGMHLLVPRSAAHAASAYNVATSSSIGPDASATYMYILAIYPNFAGATCAGRPFVSGTAGCDYSARDSGRFYISAGGSSEPNGNNCLGCSLMYNWNPGGVVGYYDDLGDAFVASGRFICDVGDKP